jgi:hypothetical protein
MRLLGGKMAHSQNDLPLVPVAWEFMKSELWNVDQWVLDFFNQNRNAGNLFDRVLGVAILTHLAEPKENITSEAHAIAIANKLCPISLECAWFKDVMKTHPGFHEQLELEWRERAKNLVGSFTDLADIVCDCQDQDALWQESLKRLHARDDLHRVGVLMAQATDTRGKMSVLFEELDIKCLAHAGIWQQIKDRNDERLRLCIVPNYGDFYNHDWWTAPVLRHHAKRHDEVTKKFGEDVSTLREEAIEHYWLGLFKPDGKLRDNFLMYAGELNDISHGLYGALQELGKIEPRHLFHGCCQILSYTQKGLANFASVNPFTPGDYFALVGAEEHRQLVGEMEHLTEVNALWHFKKATASTHTCEDSHDNLVDLDEWLRVEPQKISPPAMDMLLDIDTAPEWLKQHVAGCVKSDSSYAIVQIVGFLARIGDDETRKRASLWASTLTTDQCDKLSTYVGRKLVNMIDEIEMIRRVSTEYPDETAGAVAILLAERDECESILWVIESAGSDPEMDLSHIEKILQRDTGILFETPLGGINAWTTNLLRMVRERCPACWWAARANLS